MEKAAFGCHCRAGFGRVCYVVTHACNCSPVYTFANEGGYVDLYSYTDQHARCYNNQGADGNNCNADLHQYTDKHAESYEYSEADRHAQANGYPLVNANSCTDEYVSAHEYAQADQHAVAY